MKFSDIEMPSNRSFGLVFFVVFLVFGSYFFLKDASKVGGSLIFVAFLFLIISVFKPNLLISLNKLWMFFGFLIGKVMSPIILGLIFFFLFTPLGIVMRIAGRDELRIKLKHGSSHWKACTNIKGSSNSFKNQF